MPSTITAYYTFSPATKARSSEANTNFSNHRGTLVPIEENTAAASNNAHAIGQVDHRWTTFYGGTVDLRGMTTTSNLVIRNDTALTLGAAELLISSTTLGNFGFGQMGFAGVTSTQYTKFQYQSGGGTIDLLMGATTLASINTDGWMAKHIAPIEWTTTSNVAGVSIISEVSHTFNIDTSGMSTITSARFTAKGGGIISVGFVNTRLAAISGATGASAYFSIRLYRGLTTTAMTLCASWRFAAGAFAIGGSGQTMGVSHTWADTTTTFPILTYYDTSVTAGEIVYEWRGLGETALNANGQGVCAGTIFIQEL